MSGHTPGPWHACNGAKCRCKLIWSKPADQNVATARPVLGCVHGEWGDGPGLIYGEIPIEETEANARLIVAAPDLLQIAKACASLLVRVGDGKNEHTAEATALYGHVRAAIAKAEGK